MFYLRRVSYSLIDWFVGYLNFIWI
jgi:hypothetical protein